MQRFLAWNVIFRLQEWAKGHDTFAMLRDMEAADRLDTAALEQLQSSRLQALIGYSYTHVPYVRQQLRDAGIAPSDIRTASDLARLPLVRKADVRANREKLRSDKAGRLSAFSTGGSTGDPLIFDLARRREAARVACRQRVSRWWGLSLGDPEIALWGSPVELTRQDWIRAFRDRLLHTRLLPAFEMNRQTVAAYLDILESDPCKQVFGYPSSLYLLCMQAQEEGRNLRALGIKAAFVTGEVLLPHQRAFIAETLNCPVANGYGGRDSGFISHECPQGGMHILSDATVVELLDGDGRPVAPGETGEIVVTDLYSHEAPFIRYCTGDLAAFSTKRCGCGRALPLLDRIEGRSNDSIVTPDGRIINSLALIYAVREVEGVEQFRIRQKAADRFHIQMVRTAAYRETAEQHIRQAWTKLLRASVTVVFEYLPALPPDRSGKFRHVVSDIPAGQSLAVAAHAHVPVQQPE